MSKKGVKTRNGLAESVSRLSDLRMNIIQVSSGRLRIPVEKGGGVESYIFDLSRHLSSIGHKVTILDCFYNIYDEEIDWIDGVKIIRLEASHLDKSISPVTNAFGAELGGSLSFDRIFFSLRVLNFLAYAERFDIVHVHFADMARILAMKQQLRKKLVYSCHTARRYSAKNTVLDRFSLSVEEAVVKRVAKCIMPDMTAKNSVVSKTRVNPSKVTVIPTAIVDTDIFKPNNPTHQELSKSDSFRVLFVGRIRESKGVEYLVEAANTLINKWGYASIIFILVGPFGEFTSKGQLDSYSLKIQKMIKEYKLSQNVYLKGVLDSKTVRHLFATCSLFVLPSLEEAVPLSLSQAMASGLPVIATNVGAVSYQIQDGVNGFLINSGDAQAIAKRIRYFFENPSERKSMGLKSREIVLERLSWNKAISSFIATYNEAISYPNE